MAKTILVVDDEKAIRDILILNLEMEGYQTISAEDGKQGLALALAKKPDLILLDVMLPHMDGFAVCKAFRAEDRLTPVIMLTAREEEQDMVLGLDLGADDYITKPFSVRALLARVKTNIRRSGGAEISSGQKRLELGRITIDLAHSQVYKDGTPVDLTQREFRLLCTLTANPGQVSSREALMQEVWQYEYYGDLRAVDVAVCRLREKVEEDASHPQYIMTKRGAGYYFNVTP